MVDSWDVRRELGGGSELYIYMQTEGMWRLNFKQD